MFVGPLCEDGGGRQQTGRSAARRAEQDDWSRDREIFGGC